MVAEVANTTVSVLGGTTIDAYGNVRDASIVLLAGVPASLVETSRQVSDPSTQAPRTVRSVTCVVPDWAGVTLSSQLRDESTGQTYAVEEILRPSTLMGAPVDTVLTLRRITAITG
jgi:hypothetical protein